MFPGQQGGFLRAANFRERVFKKIVREALGAGRHFSPHGLRHTWASLHMAGGTPLKWIQEQGGWTTARVLLDTYAHFMPTESYGFADALTDGPGRPYTAPASEQHEEASAENAVTPRLSMRSQRHLVGNGAEIPDHARRLKGKK